MATLQSLIGRPLHELSEDEITNWIENLRSTRQSFTENAYEERTARRKTASKRKGPQITAEFLAEIDELSDDLDL
jgi:hypothetical protein